LAFILRALGIHRVAGDQFGLAADGFFGPLPQENTPTGDWPTFYAERRLRPGLRMAVDEGHLPPALARQVEGSSATYPRSAARPSPRRSSTATLSRTTGSAPRAARW